MKQRPVLYRLSLMLCLLWPGGCTGDEHAIASYGDFMHRLEGNWKGCAVTTPVGPRPYDIHFRRDGTGNLSGIADPGSVSDHHWSYRMQGELLRLRFLSTFRGNDVPIWLSATSLHGSTVTFRSATLARLRLQVTVLEDRQNIDVYLHQQAHVRIRLHRAELGDTSASHCEPGRQPEARPRLPGPTDP